MKFKIKIFLIYFCCLFLIGCGTPIQKISGTASGKPEVIINSDTNVIKNELINRLSNYGYSIETDSFSSIVFSRPTDETWVRLMAGNGYSSNERVTGYTFVKVDGGVRVISSPALRARMPGGKINFVEIHNMNNIYNLYQEQLNSVKSMLESK